MFLFFALCCCLLLDKHTWAWQVGVGKYDITPSVTEVGFMGYGNPAQSGLGLHYRLHARAFVFVDKNDNRIAYVNIGAAMIFHETKKRALELLHTQYNLVSFDEKNLMISATHTHSGPGGFTFFSLYDITTWGFQRQSLETVAAGVARAVWIAHSNLKNNVKLDVVTGELVNPQTNINRSPSAYLANPAAERAMYKHNVDKNVTLLRLTDANNVPFGMIHWFAVHGTSMNNTNQLVSGDNKGHAMHLFERWQQQQTSQTYVSSFSQSNEGDVSPNTKGAFCPDGTPCQFVHSTCGGMTEGCRGVGPGVNGDMYESTRIIGEQQFEHARKMFAQPGNAVSSDELRYVHTFVDFRTLTVAAHFSGTGKDEHTCAGALGDGFAAGTTDGPGMFDFTQGTNSTSKNPFWNKLGATLHKPDAAQIACQAPKPILLDSGQMTFPAPWSANVMPLQMYMLGRELVIIGVPGEFTTMAGRRLRRTVRSALEAKGAIDSNTVILIAGLTNQYSHYITTREEYHQQRYEGASTLFGQHTLAGYQQEYFKLAAALATHAPVAAGPTPPDFSTKTFDFLPPVVVDGVPISKSFGDVHKQPSTQYTALSGNAWPLQGTLQYAQSVVRVEFWGADPRAKPLIGESYIQVSQLKKSTNKWNVILDDDEWITRFHWRRSGLDHSIWTVEVLLNKDYFDLSVGNQFRVEVSGYHQNLLRHSSRFTGTSNVFTIN